MLLAAMLAMVLAAAAPALGQGDIGDVNEGDDQFNVGDETVYSAVCQNILGSFDVTANQNATADASATAGDNAAAAAEIAQEQNVSVAQVNECLNAFATASPVAHGGGDGGGGGGGGGGAATATALPATGGMVPSSALALGAGALLVGGGLLARRIAR
jgi:LPXTG-motif cell wall-anchored protein